MKANHLESSLEVNFLTKPKAFVSLMKLRLSSLVVLSAFFGYLMAKGDLILGVYVTYYLEGY